MRAAFCVVVILLGFASAGHAQDSGDKINPRWKKIEIPTIDPNFGMTARFGADIANLGKRRIHPASTKRGAAGQ